MSACSFLVLVRTQHATQVVGRVWSHVLTPTQRKVFPDQDPVLADECSRWFEQALTGLMDSAAAKERAKEDIYQDNGSEWIDEGNDEDEPSGSDEDGAGEG